MPGRGLGLDSGSYPGLDSDLHSGLDSDLDSDLGDLGLDLVTPTYLVDGPLSAASRPHSPNPGFPSAPPLSTRGYGNAALRARGVAVFAFSLFSRSGKRESILNLCGSTVYKRDANSRGYNPVTTWQK